MFWSVLTLRQLSVDVYTQYEYAGVEHEQQDRGHQIGQRSSKHRGSFCSLCLEKKLFWAVLFQTILYVVIITIITNMYNNMLIISRLYSQKWEWSTSEGKTVLVQNKSAHWCSMTEPNNKQTCESHPIT